MKIVIDVSCDKCSLPTVHREAWEWLNERGFFRRYTFREFNNRFFEHKHRTSPTLIKLVENEGNEDCPRVSGPFRELQVVEVPDDVEWDIVSYRSGEKVVEKHRSWG
ncbi:MAG: hypothetical protein Q8N08_07770 [Methanobacteriaceae archaeon]|nr:hypothetical protein [Methanobacteriaceae archaeon]